MMIVKEELEALVLRYRDRLDDLEHQIKSFERMVERHNKKMNKCAISIETLKVAWDVTEKRKTSLEEFIEQTW